MSTNETTEALRRFILDNFPRARQGVLGVEDRLLEKGIIDSLGLLTLIGFVESTFGISVSASDLTEDKFASIQTLASFVEESRSSRQQEAI